MERDTELAELEALIDRAKAGRGSVAVVEGPPGVGKTRLLRAAASPAEAEGLEVLTARGGVLEGDFALGVARQLLEPALAVSTKQGRERLLRGAAGLAVPALELDAPGSKSADPEFAILHGLYWLAANLAAERPLLVVVDDVHWCDEPSLRWLAYLVPRLEGLAIALLLGLRTGEPETARDPLLSVTSDPAVVRIEPRPLSEGAVAALVLDSFGPDADPGFCAACYAATGGNAFLVRALINTLAQEEVPARADSVSRVQEEGPESVARNVRLRVERLSSEAVAVAQAVAILGTKADLRQAALLADLDQANAAEAADALTAIEILDRGRPLDFVHPIARQAIYGDLSPSDRAGRHARAARLIAADGADPDEVAAHLLQAEPAADAWVVEQLRLAAERALEVGAPDTAAAYLHRALAEPPSQESPHVLRELGAAELRAGQLVGSGDETEGPAIGHLRRALEMTDDPRLRARTARDLGDALWGIQRYPEAVEVFERAIEDLADRDPELALQLESHLVAAAWLGGSTAGLAAKRLSRLRALEPSGPAESMLLAVKAWYELDRCRPVSRVVELAEKATPTGPLLAERTTPQLPNFLVIAFSWSDRFDAAEQVATRMLSEAREGGNTRALAMALGWRSDLNYRRGLLFDAEADGRTALDVLTAMGAVDFPATRAILIETLIERGDLTTASEVCGSAPSGKDLPSYWGWNYFLFGRGRLRQAQGKAEQALEDFLVCGARHERWQAINPAVVPWRSAAATAYAALGNVGEARRLASEEVELARSFGAPRAIGIALDTAGLIEGKERGIALLSEAVEVLESSGADLEHARALTDLGAALRRSNRRKDARAPLRRGLDIAHRCGGQALAERAREELLATGARPRRLVLTGVDALTASERRVAELATKGLTNREIAQSLFVTPRTVEVHLSHAYAKLEIASRAELAGALGDGSADASE